MFKAYWDEGMERELKTTAMENHMERKWNTK